MGYRQKFQHGAAALAAMLAASCATPQAQPPPSAAEEPPVEESPGLPKTDIYLARMAISDDGFFFGPAHNATRHAGYDNQPFFVSGDAAFLYTSEGAGGRTDIWRFDFETGVRARITETPDAGEYSPQLAPDGRSVSVLHQNALGDVQNIYVHSPGATSGAQVLDLNPVGYYAWARHGAMLVMYVLGEPATLQVADLATGDARIVHHDIGRSIHAVPGEDAVLFTAPREDGGLRVMRLNLAGETTEALFDLPGETQDFAVVPARNGQDIGFVAASQGSLFYRASVQDDWSVVADLDAAGLTDVTRLAVSADGRWIALVAAD